MYNSLYTEGWQEDKSRRDSNVIGIYATKGHGPKWPGLGTDAKISANTVHDIQALG